MATMVSTASNEGFEVIKKNPVLFVPVTAFFGVMAMLGLFVGLTGSIIIARGAGVAIVNLGLVIAAVTVAVLTGVVAYALLQCMAAEAVGTGATTLYGGVTLLKDRLIPFVLALVIVLTIAASIIVGLALIVPLLGVGAMGAAIAFITVILLQPLFLFAPIAVTYSSLGPIEALLESVRTAKAHFLSVLGFTVVMFLMGSAIELIAALLGIVPMVGPFLAAAAFIGYISFYVVSATEFFSELD